VEEKEMCSSVIRTNFLEVAMTQQKPGEMVFAECETVRGRMWVIGTDLDAMASDLIRTINLRIKKGVNSVKQVSEEYMRSLYLNNFDHGVEMIRAGYCKSYVVSN
jgi:hypothetical protein